MMTQLLELLDTMKIASECPVGKTAADAQSKAYALARSITWEKAYYRTDIGYRAVARETAQ